MRYLLAIDPSLTASGWALFEISSSNLLDVGVITAPSAAHLLASRLMVLQERVDKLFNEMALSKDDYMVLEGPAPLVLNPQSAQKVELVRGIFETLARSRGVTVPGRINPRTVQAELLGMQGAQLARPQVKKIARTVAEQMYSSEFKSRGKVAQDIIDATLVGTVALSRLRLAQKSDQDILTLFSERISPKRSRAATSWRNVKLSKLR